MIPQLPTDNLYKFMTLGGVFIMAFSIWVSRDITEQLGQGEIAYAQSSYNFDRDADVVSRATDMLDQQVNRTNELLDEAKKPENINDRNRSQMAIEAYEETQKTLAEVQLKRTEFLKTASETKTQEVKLQVLLKKLSNDVSLFRYFYLIGAAIASLGLTSWYFKHQRYQDELLRLQCENAKSPNSAITPTVADQPE
jgi:hypothetical protein